MTRLSLRRGVQMAAAVVLLVAVAFSSSSSVGVSARSLSQYRAATKAAAAAEATDVNLPCSMLPHGCKPGTSVEGESASSSSSTVVGATCEGGCTAASEDLYGLKVDTECVGPYTSGDQIAACREQAERAADAWLKRCQNCCKPLERLNPFSECKLFGTGASAKAKAVSGSVSPLRAGVTSDADEYAAFDECARPCTQMSSQCMPACSTDDKVCENQCAFTWNACVNQCAAQHQPFAAASTQVAFSQPRPDTCMGDEWLCHGQCISIYERCDGVESDLAASAPVVAQTACAATCTKEWKSCLGQAKNIDALLRCSAKGFRCFLLNCPRG